MRRRLSPILAAAALAAGCHARVQPAPSPAALPPPPPGHVLLVPLPEPPEVAAAGPARYCVTVDGPGGRGRQGACADAGGRALIAAPARDFVLRVSVRPASGSWAPEGGRWPELVGGAGRGEVLLVQPGLPTADALETRTRLLRGEEAAREIREAFAGAPSGPPRPPLADPDTLSVTEFAR